MPELASVDHLIIMKQLHVKTKCFCGQKHSVITAGAIAERASNREC